MKRKATFTAALFLAFVSGALYYLLIGFPEGVETDKQSQAASAKLSPTPKGSQKAGDDPKVELGNRKQSSEPIKEEASAAEIVKKHDFEKVRREWEQKQNKDSGAQRLKKAWAKKNSKKKGFNKKSLSADEKQRWQKWAKAKNFYLEPTKKTITARLVDTNQRPIAGAKITLRRSQKIPDQRSDLETRSDEEGRFSLSGIRYQFYLNIEGPPGFVGLGFLVPWTESEEIDLGDLVLKASTVFTGFVESPAGQALEGVTLRLFSKADYSRYLQAENVAYVPRRAVPVVTGQTNASGYFSLNAPAGDGVVVAEKEGYRTSIGFELSATVDRSRNHTLRLRQGKDVTITVKDQEGHVLEGSEARLLRFGELYNPAWNQPVLATVTTNDQGQALFKNLTKSRYQVAVMVEGDSPVTKNFQVNFDAAVEIEVVVQRSVAVKGQLKSDSEDTPLSSATLLVYREGPDGLRDARQINAKVAVGPDGRFQLGRFHSGRYVLLIQNHSAFFPATKHFEVVSGGEELDLGEIQLTSLTQVNVRVLDSSDKGVSGCRFTLSSSTFDEFRYAESPDQVRASSNEEGRATIVNMPKGQVTVTLLGPGQEVLGYQTLTVTSDSDQKIELRVATETGTLHGIVSGPAGENFPGGRLELRPEFARGQPIDINVTKDGRYRKEKIPQGAYAAFFLPTGSQERRSLRTVTVVKDQDTEQDFQ